MRPKLSVIFVRYSREFVITVIVITEFYCTIFGFIQKCRHRYHENTNDITTESFEDLD